MVEQEEIETLKNYFTKLKKVLMYNSDFTFFNYSLIKKSKIDDILCCILATFPDSYKNMMKQKEGKNYTSILAYSLLFNAIKNKFVLNPEVYLVSFDNVTKYLDTILRDIEKDIIRIEKISY